MPAKGVIPLVRERGLFRRSGGELLFCSRPKKKPKNAA